MFEIRKLFDMKVVYMHLLVLSSYRISLMVVKVHLEFEYYIYNAVAVNSVRKKNTHHCLLYTAFLLKVSMAGVFILVHWHERWENHCLNIVYNCYKSLKKMFVFTVLKY